VKKYTATVHLPLRMTLRQTVEVEAENEADAQEALALAMFDHCAYVDCTGGISVDQPGAAITLWDEVAEDVDVEVEDLREVES